MGKKSREGRKVVVAPPRPPCFSERRSAASSRLPASQLPPPLLLRQPRSSAFTAPCGGGSVLHPGAGARSCWSPAPAADWRLGWRPGFAWPGPAGERCGSAAKTVARDAGANAPHQVLPARRGDAGAGVSLRRLRGSGDAGFGRFRVSSFQRSQMGEGLKVESSEEPTLG